MQELESEPQGRGQVLIAALFGAVSLLAALDLVGDLREGATVGHVVVEGAIVVIGAAGLAAFLLRYVELRRREHRAREAAVGLAADLCESRDEARSWRARASELSAGLGELIDEQLGRWDLTAAEREVALLLLKGLSHKEVASLRGVSQATARQQAAAVYRKAGVGGRHDLSAFFLEDLLAPRTREDGRDGKEAGGPEGGEVVHG